MRTIDKYAIQNSFYQPILVQRKLGCAILVTGLIAGLSIDTPASAAQVNDITLSGRSSFIVGGCNNVSVVLSRTSTEMSPSRLNRAVSFTLQLRLQFPNGGQGQYSRTGRIDPYAPVTNVQFRGVNAPSSGTYNVTTLLNNRRARSESFRASGDCRPDLVVQGISCSQVSSSNRSQACQVRVSNRGIDSPGAYNISLRALRPDGSMAVNLSGRAINNLAGFTVTYPSAGTYRLQAIADSNNNVRESNERNNAIIQSNFSVP